MVSWGRSGSVSHRVAHNGWPRFGTDSLICIEGTVSSYGVWGKPRSLFEIIFDSDLPAKVSWSESSCTVIKTNARKSCRKPASVFKVGQLRAFQLATKQTTRQVMT